MSTKDKIKEEIISWNNKFPVDRWWRRKYNIPFMSSTHREISFLDQLFDYYEDDLVQELSEREKDPYIPNQGDWLKADDTKSQIERAREEFERDFLNG